ncbi:MAG: SIMPL domain-containing protein [Bacteroidetes bacterium]|nr:MAG: SIMPL domain-containing protein [Bacteroidota bacterium]
MKNWQSTIGIGFIAIVCTYLLAQAYTYKFKNAETIVVTGLAEKDFTSDQIVWKGTFTRTNSDLKQAFAQIQTDAAAVKNYLRSKGVADSSVELSSVEVNKNYNQQYDGNGNPAGSVFSGYTLSNEVKIDSRNIALVEKISREITELLQTGIEINSQKPSYYFSQLNTLKIDLLSQASKDAKLRATTIADASDGKLGSMKKATMGVFQITGKNDNESYSYGGSFNTSSKEKTASITLKVEYTVD